MRVKTRNGRRYLDVGVGLTVVPSPTDLSELESLAASPNRDDRRRVAQSSLELPISLINQLSLDEDSAVLEALASRRQPLSYAVLRRLFQSTSVWVRAGVIHRQQPLPKGLIVEASRDPDEEVLLSLVNRSDFDLEEAVVNLLTSEYTMVREVAAERLRRRRFTIRPSMIAAAAQETSPAVRRNLTLAFAGRLGASEAFSDPDTETWRRVGITTFTTNRRLLAKAAQDEEPLVRLAATQNRSLRLTPSLLNTLRNDPDDRVQAAAGQRFLDLFGSR